MGKPEASVAGPGVVRPPRPSPRDGARSGTPAPALVAPLDAEVVVIHPAPEELAVTAEEPSAEALPPEKPVRRTGSLRRAAGSPDAVTPPLAALPASPVSQRELRVLDLPVAALEKPSTTLEPTPSPVPRVSLRPDGEEPERAPIGVINSRNLPTVAARYLAPQRPLPVRQRPAAAVTFPPDRMLPREARIARRLAADVRSSKREIILGLSIGMALAAALGFLGQRYLVKSAPAPVQGAEPRPSVEPPATAREEWSLRPRAPAPAQSAALAEAQESSSRESPAPASEVAKRPRRPRVKVATSQRAPAPAVNAAPRAAAPPPEEARGSAEEWIDSQARAKAPLSPAESAGLAVEAPF